jgi:hypothetical protein
MGIHNHAAINKYFKHLGINIKKYILYFRELNIGGIEIKKLV